MTHGNMARFVTSGFAFVLALALAAPISAQRTSMAARRARGQQVHAEIITILAKESPGTIDPQLTDFQALRRAPFNIFRTMEVLEKSEYDLPVRENRDLQLPNGRHLRVQLQPQAPDGRYRVRVSINREGQNDYLPLLQVRAAPGDPFFVVGQRHQGGTLVIGIRIGNRPARPAKTPRRSGARMR